MRKNLTAKKSKFCYEFGYFLTLWKMRKRRPKLQIMMVKRGIPANRR